MIDAKIATEQLIAAIKGPEAQARLKKVCASVNGDRGRPVKLVFRLGSNGIEFAIGSPNCPMEQITAAETAKDVIEPIKNEEPPEPPEVVKAAEAVTKAEQALKEFEPVFFDAYGKLGTPRKLASEDFAEIEGEYNERMNALQAAKGRHGQLYRLWRLQLMMDEEQAKREERERIRRAEQESRRSRILSQWLRPKKEASE
jgi:hypothetical protein